MSKDIGIYLHVPFCATKCPYCDFYSVPYRSELAERYVVRMLEEIKGYRLDCDVATIYFGGGTPSLLKPEQIGRLVDTIGVDGAEVTLEANPNTLTLAKLHQYHAVGINRISMGMQSVNPTELTALGRTHTNEQLKSAIAWSIEAGISNISLDVMLGTPYQTADSLAQTLQWATSQPITHISAYLLKAEENTPYYNSSLLSHCVDEDAICEMYLMTAETLSRCGLKQYEISNFAREGYESQHNLRYWQCEDYIGIGAAAHSCYAGKRFFHPPDIERYISGGSVIVEDEPPYTVDEYIMLGLRLCKGISLAKLSEVYAMDCTQVNRYIKRLCDGKFATLTGERLALTPTGMLMSNAIIAQLLETLH